MRNMSYIVAKSCRLFHTITYIQYQVNTMHLTWENEVCQKVARICPNPRRLGILRTNFFPGPETFRNGSPTLISTIPEVFSKIQRFSSWEIGQKPHSRPFWGPNLGKDILGKRQVLSFSVIETRTSYLEVDPLMNGRERERESVTDFVLTNGQCRQSGENNIL